MSNKDDKDLDNKIADDMFDDDDVLSELDDGNDLDELDGFSDVDEDDIKRSSSERMLDLDDLDDEIEELKSSNNDLEDEYMLKKKSRQESDEDDFSTEEDNEPDESDESDESAADDETSEEESSGSRNKLIMKAAQGVFVVMVGFFVYNLMFAGEVPNEENLMQEPVIIDRPLVKEIDINTVTPSIDDSFIAIEDKISKENELKKESVAIITEKPVLISEPVIEIKEVTHNASNTNSNVDMQAELYRQLTKNISRAHGLTLTDVGGETYIIGQDGATNYKSSNGTEIPYYGYSVKVISAWLEGKLVLLSNGTFVDKEKAPLDNEIIRLAEMQKEMELSEKTILKNQEDQEKARLIKIAEDKAREEERLKAEESRLTQENDLKKALDRLNKLASEVEAKKEEDSKPKVIQPKLLEGWSVNGEFKSVKNGFVLNGYLIRDADGNFYKMLIGDTHQEFGLIRGYDGNGRFFIGNYYIL